MNNINNHTGRHIEVEEMQGILDAAKTLERTFRKKVHSISINPTKNNKEDVYGVAFAFDMNKMV